MPRVHVDGGLVPVSEKDYGRLLWQKRKWSADGIHLKRVGMRVQVWCKWNQKRVLVMKILLGRPK